MPIRWQKKLWWGLLLMSAGGTLALLILSISASMLPPLIWWVWPPLLLVSSLALVRCYRREPSSLRGFWHLRIDDLIATGLYVGILLSVLKPLLGRLFVPVGVIFAGVNAAAFIIGCLATERSGRTARVDKLVFAFAYGTRLVGLVASATVMVVMFMDGIAFGMPFWWTRLLFTSSYWKFVPEAMIGWLVLHRMALGCLPAGIALYWVVRARPAIVLDQEPPPGRPTTPIPE